LTACGVAVEASGRRINSVDFSLNTVMSLD
jgi:hypothetical protein